MRKIKTLQALGFIAQEKKITTFKARSIYNLRQKLSSQHIVCDLTGSALETLAFERPWVFSMTRIEFKIKNKEAFDQLISSKIQLSTLSEEVKATLITYED